MIRAAALLALVATGCAEDVGPRLERVTPAAAARGAVVTITGERLCGEPADCESAGGAIRIGLDPPTVQATILAYSDTSAEIMIPSIAPLGPTELVVTVNERGSNALAFEVLP